MVWNKWKIFSREDKRTFSLPRHDKTYHPWSKSSKNTCDRTDLFIQLGSEVVESEVWLIFRSQNEYKFEQGFYSQDQEIWLSRTTLTSISGNWVHQKARMRELFVISERKLHPSHLGMFVKKLVKKTRSAKEREKRAWMTATSARHDLQKDKQG